MKLLSPAGDFESLKMAVFYGADEVYLGVKDFNARNNIAGFDLASLKEAVDFAHIFGVRVHLTVNILFRDEEMGDALDLVVHAYNWGVDAFIVQDVGLASLIHEFYPEIEMHASTQMGIHNLEGVLALQKLGFKRVVLSRETPLSEIRRIKDNTDVEIEYMRDEISQINGVKSVEYIDKDMAYQDAQEVFKDQAYFLEGLDKVQIFPASFIVKFSNIEQSEAVKSEVENVDGIYKVKYNQSTIEAAITLSNVANIFLLGVGAVMLIVSIFIISNTIKLAVYSNQREIFIMRYIGATNKFIKKPFIVEGALIGLMSAAISFILISIAYIVLYARLPQIGSSLGVFGFVPYSTLWYQILIAFIVLGLFIGIFGSSISIKKYLKA